MIRTLLASTAIAALLATGAVAQSADNAGNQNKETAARMDGGFYAADENARLASNLLGKSVYASADPDAERIGEINDFVVDPDGDMGAAIVGVGGFLGIGEKEVAVGFDQLQWEKSQDGEDWLVLATTKQELEAAPAFDRTAFDRKMQPAEDQAAMQDDQAQQTGDQAAMQTEEQPQDEMAAVSDQGDTNQQDQMATDRRQDLTSVPPDEISAEELIGTTVYGANEENVGEIGDVILTSDGQIDAIVIDVGGFLGLGEKPVAVGFEDLEFFTEESGTWYLYTSFSEEQLDNQVAYDPETYGEQRDQQRLVQ